MLRVWGDTTFGSLTVTPLPHPCQSCYYHLPSATCHLSPVTCHLTYVGYIPQPPLPHPPTHTHPTHTVNRTSLKLTPTNLLTHPCQLSLTHPLFTLLMVFLSLTSTLSTHPPTYRHATPRTRRTDPSGGLRRHHRHLRILHQGRGRLRSRLRRAHPAADTATTGQVGEMQKD